jgi:hypothetical protein
MTEQEKEALRIKVQEAWQKVNLQHVLTDYTIEVHPDELDMYTEAYDWDSLGKHFNIRIRVADDVEKGKFAVIVHDVPESL